MPEDDIVHGIEWTVKELFVYPNEYIYSSIQIVMYPYMTGLVAGAFVLSSLYHVFGQEKLKEIAQFSLVFSLALLPVVHDDLVTTLTCRRTTDRGRQAIAVVVVVKALLLVEVA